MKAMIIKIKSYLSDKELSKSGKYICWNAERQREGNIKKYETFE